MYRRTGGADLQLPRHPARARSRTRSRTFSSRTDNPADVGVAYWAYNAAAQGQPADLRATPARSRSARRRSAPPTSRRTRRTSRTRRRRCRSAPLPVAHGQQPVPARRVRRDRRVEHGRGRPDRCRQGLLDDQHQGRDARARRPTRPTTTTTRSSPPSRTSSCSLPRTDWTPTGAGPVEFTVAPPATWAIVQAECKGYDRVGLQQADDRPPVRQRLRARADRGLRREQRLHPGRDLGRERRDHRRPGRPAVR